MNLRTALTLVPILTIAPALTVLADKTSHETKTLMNLPPVASLDEHSDYSVYVAHGVSASIQRAALRKLFHQPEFNRPNSLNEYGDHIPLPVRQVPSQPAHAVVAAKKKIEPASVQSGQADAHLPPIESLNENSDYSVFLAPGVSDSVQRAALRKLFHLPEFDQPSSMNAYGY
jgi:hypothetical protein